MKSTNIVQTSLNIGTQLVTQHSICCGTQFALAGVQIGLSGTSSYAMQGLPYIVAPAIAAFFVWGRGMDWFKKPHADCHDHCHPKPKSKLKRFLTSSALGYGVNLAMAATLYPGNNHLPQGPAEGWYDPQQQQVVVTVKDTSQIWPRSHRYFINPAATAVKQLDGQTIKAQLIEINMLEAGYKRLFNQTTKQISGQMDTSMPMKDYALAARMPKNRAQDFIRQKQKLTLTALVKGQKRTSYNL